MTSPAAPLPEWLEYRGGAAPVLLIAPHGGRRPPLDLARLKPNIRSNDVHTAELTRVVAARLDATALINHGMDRNALDLNRVSQVRREAPWLVECIAGEIERLLRLHRRVTVVFIHGWNTGTAACDIGVGATGTPTAPVVEQGAHLTMTPADLARFACCLGVGDVTEVTLGQRYPASHHNNLVQLFGRRSDASTDAERRIAAWAEAGEAQALQLELGVPLRWPGPWRDRFLDRLTQALASMHDSTPTPEPSDVEADTGSLRTMMPLSVQAYDATSGLGISAGIGTMGETSIARVLLFLGGQRIALFTGEAPNRREVGPLRLRQVGERVDLSFEGPMLVLDDASLYVDLENGMASSRLVDARISATFAGTHVSSQWRGVNYGHIRSSVTIAGATRALRAPAIAGTMPVRVAGGFVRTSLIAAFEDGGHVMTRGLASGEVLAEQVGDRAVEQISDTKLEVIAESRLAPPRRFDWSGAGIEATLRATPISHMPIVRGLGNAGYLRVTFGVAHVEWGRRRGHALYEHSEPI